MKTKYETVYVVKGTTNSGEPREFSTHRSHEAAAVAAEALRQKDAGHYHGIHVIECDRVQYGHPLRAAPASSAGPREKEKTVKTKKASSLELVWTATWDWLHFTERHGMEVDWSAEPIQYDSSEWPAACDLAQVDPEDDEVGFGVLIEPRDCDTLLRPGDIVCTQGYGGDIAFLRRKAN